MALSIQIECVVSRLREHRKSNAMFKKTESQDSCPCAGVFFDKEAPKREALLLSLIIVAYNVIGRGVDFFNL